MKKKAEDSKAPSPALRRVLPRGEEDDESVGAQTFAHLKDSVNLREVDARLRAHWEVVIRSPTDEHVLAFVHACIGAAWAVDGLVFASPVTRAVVLRLAKLAQSDITIRLHGPSGSGKEVLARLVRGFSPRAGGPFVALNAAALSEKLAESELFGHVQGAFTGAHSSRAGVFERAHGGTLFLDEIGELSPRLQLLLLRVLQEGVVDPVGGDTPIAVDVRVVAATHRSLAALVAGAAFRGDLTYRLGRALVVVPPLAQRREDIAPIVFTRLARLAPNVDAVAALSPAAWRALLTADLDGNVRELIAVLDAAWASKEGDRIEVEDLNLVEPGSPDQARPSPRPEAGMSADELVALVVAASTSEGLSIRRVAAKYGITRSKVERILRAAKREGGGKAA